MENNKSWLPVGVTPETTSGNQREPQANKKLLKSIYAFLSEKIRFAA